MSRPLAERWLVPFLLANIAAVLVAYASLLVPIARDGRYMPAWTDEYGYVLDARSFAQNGTLHAARLKEEHVSRVFEASTHGPAYILLQGGIARLLGDPVRLSVWPNVVALGVACALILAYRVSLAQRLAIVLLLLLNFAVFLYAFTWMVESYQVPFAVAATLLLVTLHRRGRDAPGFSVRLAGFIVLLLVLALFRVSYALWVLGLLPLARSRGELVRYGALALLVIAAGVLLMQLLSAANPYWPLSRAARGLARGEVAAPLLMLARNVGVNVTRYFVGETQGLTFYLAMKYVVVALGAILLGGAVLRRDRLALAACLVLGAHLALLFLLYDAHTWREHRHLAPVFYLLVVVLVVGRYWKACAALYLVLLALFPEVYGYATQRIIPERRWVAAQWAAHEGAQRSFAQLAALVSRPDGGTITVLHAKDFYRNMSLVPLALPVKTNEGSAIRYTANLGATPDTRRWNRIAIDYVMVPRAHPAEPGWTLVHDGAYFALYDVRPAAGGGSGGRSPRSSTGEIFRRATSAPSKPSSAARSSS